MAIMACQAGKDVYVEKPLCQTIHEGQMIRDAARKHNRVVQVGTQRRSMEHFKGAAELRGVGRNRKVPLIKAWINQIRIDIGKSGGWHAACGRELRPLAGRRSGAAVQRESLSLHVAILLGLRQQRDRQSGNPRAGCGIWGDSDDARVMAAKCLPKRVSATGGIYWLDDAKEVPDTQSVNYDYGDMMLNFELRSFATDYLMPHTAPRIGPKSAGGPADFATAYYGTEATVLALQRSLGSALARWESGIDEGGRRVA